MLLLVILVGLAFGALLIPMIITQDQTTRFDVSRTRSLHAAEAGLDVGLGLVRAATPDGKAGDTTKLPCGPLAGNVGAGSGTYTVAVAYYTSDPGAHVGDATWLSNNAMLCVKDYGPYDPTTKSYVPSYALLTANGSDGPGVNGASPGRTLRTTYVVKTTNSNIAGGLISIYPDGMSTDRYCMDAGSAPTLGTVIVTTPCQPNSPAQSFSYNTDLSIQLVSSVTDASAVGTARGNGLCLDSAAPHATDRPIALGWCAAQTKGADGVLRNTAAPWNQQWSSDDSAHLRGAKPDRSDVDNFCIDFRTPGQPITLRNCAGGVTDVNQTWVPTPNVGAGAAGAPDPLPAGYLATPHQLVNFLQFGRCLDVTNTNVASDYLIAYSCKQNPNPGRVLWNQKWAYDSRGQWVTYNGGNSADKYCLTSPRTAGAYVKVTQCPATPNPTTTWTNNLTQDASGNELPYKHKYTMVDSGGLCLSLSPATDLLNGQYYKTITATCDGSAAQKWNALPNAAKPVLQNTIELPYAG